MKALPPAAPTSEQLPIINYLHPGVVVIRGSAGSGKTTTALQRLRQLSIFWLLRHQRIASPTPVRILVATFNKTLRGYIENLAAQQISGDPNLDLEISTFSFWAKSILDPITILDNRDKDDKIKALGAAINLPSRNIVDEVDYILGRFPYSSLGDYIDCKREGRGLSPRFEKPLRAQLLNDVVYPYLAWKQSLGVVDWNDLPVLLLQSQPTQQYDIIIADEAQDLSANQVRALIHYAAPQSSLTFVLDAAQRIYPRGFSTWKEAGVNHVARAFRLTKNHRNTSEICEFALPLLEGLDIGDDGTFPDFSTCQASGIKPKVLVGLYNQQVTYCIDHINNYIDLDTDSVAFLKPLGGGRFSYLTSALERSGLDYETITRQSEWPRGNTNIALSTMNSAKGLEFDHVFILGLSDDVTPYGPGDDDTDYQNHRRLLAMAITRARKSVIGGYKKGEKSGLIDLFAQNTYDEIEL